MKPSSRFNAPWRPLQSEKPGRAIGLGRREKSYEAEDSRLLFIYFVRSIESFVRFAKRIRRRYIPARREKGFGICSQPPLVPTCVSGTGLKRGRKPPPSLQSVINIRRSYFGTGEALFLACKVLGRNLTKMFHVKHFLNHSKKFS